LQQNDMSRPRKDAKRETRIGQEIVVDAYDEWERAMGWFYYLEQTLQFPFRAECAKEREQSLLRVGEKMEVIGMPPEEVCAREIYVQVKLERSDAGSPADAVTRGGNRWKDERGPGGLGVLRDAWLPVARAQAHLVVMQSRATPLEPGDEQSQLPTFDQCHQDRLCGPVQ
jgi:hypothetical protein